MGLTTEVGRMDQARAGDRQDRVLLINDSPEQLEFTGELLREAGYRVLTARDGDEGLAMAQSEGPDVVISDVVMPRMDGLELCRRIRATAALKFTPVLLVSGLATDSESAVAGLRAGADDYLEIPFDPMRLVSKVTRLIERKRAEDQRRRQLDFTEAITASLAEGVCAFDTDRRITFVNPAAEAALGWRQQELLGRDVHEVVGIRGAGGESQGRDGPLKQVLESGETIRIEDELFTRRDGTTFPVSYASSPIATGGRMVGGVLTFHDITDVRRQRDMLERVNESLERSERRYRDLVENLNDVVFSMDAEGRLLYISPAVQKYGYSSEELAGAHFSPLIHPEDLPGVSEALQRSRRGVSDPYEFRVVDRSGTIHRVRASSRSVFDGGRLVGVTGVLMDVTAQRLAEDQLRAAQRLEAVGRLAGGIAHDFNNLLVAINGYAEFAIEAVHESDPMRKDLEEILRAGNRAAALTRQLLAFSRKQVMKPEIINLNDTVGGMEAMLHRLIGEDIEFQTRRADRLGSVLADPSQMEQVIMNLVVNARDAMPTGGRLIIETSNVSDDGAPTADSGGWVVLSVADTGSGMDEQTKAQIFEPFFSTKPPGDGTGLGLPTVHGIVTQSGGTITVDTAPGKGTTFRVAFPRVRSTPRPTARTSPKPAHGKETILIVEDEPAVRQLAKRFLSAAGYRVLVAENGGEALLTCETYTGPIDLLLTDVVMPQMSGRALRDRLAQVRPGLRVLYMSGYSGTAIAHHGVLEEGMHLIQKPFNSADLARRVREVLEDSAG
jgi:PAS domain S-box-containing protein